MTAKQRAARAKFKAVVKEASKLRKKNPKLTQAQAVKQAFAISYEKDRRNPIKRIKKAVTDYVSKAKEDFKKGYYGEEYGKKSRRRKVGATPTKVKAKYEIGDMVYSYQNKNYKAPISYKKFVPWESLSKPNSKDKFVYKLKIKDGFSNWINEESLSKSILGAAPTKVKAKKSKRTSEMHTDTKSHNVNIRVMSGVEPKNMYAIRDQYENDIKVILEAINRIKNNLPNMDYTEKNRANRIIEHYKKVIIKLKKRLRDQNKLINELLK
jgi:hypothetical protein